jgi:hypothetical protein
VTGTHGFIALRGGIKLTRRGGRDLDLMTNSDVSEPHGQFLENP